MSPEQCLYSLAMEVALSPTTCTESRHPAHILCKTVFKKFCKNHIFALGLQTVIFCQKSDSSLQNTAAEAVYLNSAGNLLSVIRGDYDISSGTTLRSGNREHLPMSVPESGSYTTCIQCFHPTPWREAQGAICKENPHPGGTTAPASPWRHPLAQTASENTACILFRQT